MKSLNLFLVFALAVSLASAQMSFNLNGATYEVTGGYYSLHIPVIGGVQPMTYNYQAYPTTWIQVGNKLSIPTA